MESTEWEGISSVKLEVYRSSKKRQLLVRMRVFMLTHVCAQAAISSRL